MESKTVGETKRKFFTKRRINRALFMAAMMGPAIVGFLIFYVYVNVDSLIMAFQVNTGDSLRFGFDNFAYFLRELSVPGSVFTEAIVNTLIFFVLGFVVMLLSLVVGYFIYKKIVGYKFFRFVFYLPCIIMGTATASLFSFVIARAGPIGDLLRAAGSEIPDLLAEAPHANWMLILYQLLFTLGGNMILFLGSMTNISPEIFEAAKLDGVSWVRELFQIIVPLIWHTLSVMILQAIVGLTQASGPVFLLTEGAAGTYTINYWLYEQLLNGRNLEVSAAIGWLCTAITFPIALIAKHYLDKADKAIGV